MALNEYLTSLTSRLAAVETKLGLPVGKTPIPAAPGAGGASLESFDEFVNSTVKAFVTTSQKIGGKVGQLGDATNESFSQLRAFIDMSTKSKKPSDATPMLKPIQDSINAISALKTRDEFENHSKAVAEGIQAMMWVNPQIALPGPFCNDFVDASVFWANKVRQEWKSKEHGDLHVTWCTELNNLWKGLAAYVKSNYPTGLTWNPNGSEATASSGSTGSSSAPAPKIATGSAALNLFAELGSIDQSSGKTAGLKHVTKDMKSKNQGDKSSVVPASSSAPKPAAKKWGGGDGTPANVEPAFELQGNKWVIQGQTGVIELKEDQVSVKNTIYVFGCNGASIVIGGKVNTITIDGCKKTKVVFDNALALVETVNCRQVQVQIKGKCPTASVDKTDGYVLYLSRACVNETKIVSSKSSEMNVSFPKTDAADSEYQEYAIPEQFVHHIKPNQSGLSSDVSDLYTAG